MFWIIDRRDRVAQQVTEDADIPKGSRWIKAETDDWRCYLDSVERQERDEAEHAINVYR